MITKGLVLLGLEVVKHRGYEMKRFHVFSLDMGAEVVEVEKPDGDWVKIKDAKALEARIIDLSAKLDQAIDMLDLHQRAFLLNKWGKGE